MRGIFQMKKKMTKELSDFLIRRPEYQPWYDNGQYLPVFDGNGPKQQDFWCGFCAKFKPWIDGEIEKITNELNLKVESKEVKKALYNKILSAAKLFGENLQISANIEKPCWSSFEYWAILHIGNSRKCSRRRKSKAEENKSSSLILKDKVFARKETSHRLSQLTDEQLEKHQGHQLVDAEIKRRQESVSKMTLEQLLALTEK